MTDNIDVQLDLECARLIIQADDEPVEVYELDINELAHLADRSTQALAEVKGWEFLIRPAITLEVGNLIYGFDSPIRSVDVSLDGDTVAVMLSDDTMFYTKSSTTVGYLRRIA